MTSPQLQTQKPGLKRYYYKDPIHTFVLESDEQILGTLMVASQFPVDLTQRNAWIDEVRILKGILKDLGGTLYFEFSIPRMGRRIDVLVITGATLFVLEFKVGATSFEASAIDQVWDYALDLKNFHEASHDLPVAPILVATQAKAPAPPPTAHIHQDKLLEPMRANADTLRAVMDMVLQGTSGTMIDAAGWERGRYKPTPTIIEAATALYGGHSVHEISRTDASAINLAQTSDAISDIITGSKDRREKAICLVTGVPGAGKTLVGLNIATKHIDKSSELYSVFLSGNGPLVAILREALTRDKVRQEKERGKKLRKKEAMSDVKAFIQNVHNFRDECLIDPTRPPIEHVALFDEAQRAWTLEQTAKFMRQKKHIPDFDQSEAHFLISCLDRHPDWAVVVCLIGGGQEINTGEAGMTEWIQALTRSFTGWHVYVSSRLTDSEYDAGKALEALRRREHVTYLDDLHLAVSMRSFRAENVSLLVKQLLDQEQEEASKTLIQLQGKYPVVITRDINKARQWLRDHARGTERYGIVASSQAERLKPQSIFVKSPMDPVHWFLNDKSDVRSSYYLEDVATEFHVQGLELDWACVTWDADFRYSRHGWDHWSFGGGKWKRVQQLERQRYLKNAYRVLLTRARQGMVIVVPHGDASDPTRQSKYYDPTYDYLHQIGFSTI
jgi:hypothetical protein